MGYIVMIGATAAAAASVLGDAAAPDVTILHWFSSAGAIGVMGFVVLGFLRGWIVTGKTHERVLSERNRLLELALTSARAADRAVTIAADDRDTARRIAGTADVES